MKTALDDYIDWLNTDARRNYRHIMMAKMAKQKEVELLADAFRLGMEAALQEINKANEQKETSELPSDNV
jgi:hypothetical protein